MVSKSFLLHKNDKIFVIGKGLFDERAASEYIDAETALRSLGFSSVTTAYLFRGPTDPTDQTNWMKWCGTQILTADALYILCPESEIRKGPFELYSTMEWCRELAHSVKIPVFFEEYDGVND